MPIKQLPTQGGFFNPADLTDAVALLIEITGQERQRPTKSFGPKDTVIANVTAFDSLEDIEAGQPSEVLPGAIIQQTILARDLFAMDVGDAVVQTVTQIPSTRGLNPSWVFRSVNKKVQNAVVAYCEKRDAEASRKLEAVPDFGDDE